MSAHIITYFSRNAAPDEQWMAFIELTKGRLGITFTGPTEEAAKGKVRAFWRREQEKQAAQRTRASRPTRSREAAASA